MVELEATEHLSIQLTVSEGRPAESVREARTQHLRSKWRENYFAQDESGTVYNPWSERSSDGKNLVGVAIYNIG